MKKATFECNDMVSKDDSSAIVSDEHDIKIAILKELEVSIQMASSDFVLIPPLKRFSSSSFFAAWMAHIIFGVLPNNIICDCNPCLILRHCRLEYRMPDKEEYP